MITFVGGNIFDSPAQAITNTINTVGVMGKGLALEFKQRFPALFEDYRKRCEQGLVRPGIPYLWEDDHVQVLNFPTKRRWQDPSRIEDIEEGLKYLSTHYQEMGIQTLALPPLGCGNGGLNWENVRPLIEQYLGPLPDLEVFVYESSTAKAQKNPLEHFQTKSKKPSEPAAALPT